MFRLLILLFLIQTCWINVQAQDTSCEQKIFANNLDTYDEFGFSVSGHDDLLVVGAYGDDYNGVDAGCAYFYQWNGNDWVETKITSSDGAAGDFFGFSVAASADRVLVGAYLDDPNGSNSGSVYIFDWDGSNWQETKLIPSDGASGEYFGYSVALDGDRIVVGAHLDDHPSWPQAGSAYVFDWDGTSWVETKLVPLAPLNTANFGRHVAIDGDRVVIGSWADDINGNSNAGSAYIFDWNGSSWVETKIFASDGQPFDHYGWSVSVAGDLVAIGAKDDSDNGSDAGSAYIYNWDGINWIETKILASDGGAGDEFGDDIDAFNNRVVVGALDHKINNVQTGGAYVYDWDGSNWVETKLEASDGAAFDRYGQNVSIFGDRIAIGANRNDESGDNHGSAYIYEPSTLLYADLDNDGFGDPGNSMMTCPDAAYVNNDLDCDDSDATVNPNATELCNGEDDNCSGQIDDTILCLCPSGLQTNTFLGGSAFWVDGNNWSLGTVPTLCDEVIIPAGRSVVLLSTETGECYSLEVAATSVFDVQSGAGFDAVVPGY